jgi:hypothetical protein
VPIATEREERESLIRLDRAIWERRCRSDLTAFAIEALAPLGQTPARHHRLLIETLERVESGEIDRLMVFMPPGHGKSIYSSVLFPAWFFAQQPNRDLIGASHAANLAEDFSGRIQGQIRHNASLLGYNLLSESVQSWRTTNGGIFRAAGVGGGITGRRSDLTLIDDPLKGAADAESEIVRESQWSWYQSEVYTRRKPGSRIVLIMTRWHPDDLGGRLLQAAETGGDKWTVLKLPAICDSIHDPLGRKLGEALWPEWQDEAELARIRGVVGEYVWGALYQQDPRPRGASYFNVDHLLVDGQPVPTPEKCDTVYAVIDTAIKTGTDHNSTAVTYFAYNALTKPSTLVLDWDLVQVEGADQADWLPSIFARCEELARYTGARRGSSGAFIEDKATGMVLLQQAKNLKWPAHPIDSKLTSMGKSERAIAANPYVVAGEVKMTSEAWNKVKVHKGRSANHQVVQISDFRIGSADKSANDLLDTFCYGVCIARGTNSGPRKGI